MNQKHKITFLDNYYATSSHLIELKSLIKKSDEISIAVAFLKSSGLNLIITDLLKALKRGAKIDIICGLDFGMTDAEALETLHDSFRDYKNATLYCAQGSNIFHPKVYMFRKNTQVKIIIGSSNLTKGGLEDNYELSISYPCLTVSDDVKKVYSYFQSLIDSEDVFEASKLSIEKYKSFAREQRNIRQKYIRQKPKGSNENPLLDLNISKIKQSYDNYVKHQKPQRNFARKQENYEEARKILNKIATNRRMNQKSFQSLYGNLVGAANQGHLWDSGGINRRTNDIVNNWRKVRELVKYIKANHYRKEDVVFDGAMLLVRKIPGIGINIMTEILTTYNPEKYPVVNNSPIIALRHFGCKVKGKSSFDGSYYAEFSKLMCDLKELIGTDSLLEVDGFFNYIYWKLKYNNQSNI